MFCEQYVKSVMNNEIEVNLATIGSRIVAYILNFVIWGVMLFIVGVLWAMSMDHRPSKEEVEVFSALWVVLVSLIYLIVQCILMSRDGQSIGKKIMGIKVIDKDGETAGFVKNVLLREVLYNFILIILGIPFTLMLNNDNAANIPSFIAMAICFVMLFIDPDRRTLQDKLAGTYVVQLPKKQSLITYRMSK